MGMSTELMETNKYGVQIWVCSDCGWEQSYLSPFAEETCADYPSKIK